MSAGHRMEAALEGVPFRVVDKNKRSRFQLCDLTKLMLIVTRRESFATPHGKGDEEACQDKVAALIKKHKQESAASRWASGVTEELTELSNLIEAYWQLKSQFEEKKQAASDEAKRKQKRLATAGGKAISKAALRLKRRKIAAATEGVRRTPPTSDKEEEKIDESSRRSTPRGREDYREMVGSEYSSGGEGYAVESEEHKHEHSLSDKELMLKRTLGTGRYRHHLHRYHHYELEKELALFLLLWNDAANLRFMPECICFLYHNMATKLEFLDTLPDVDEGFYLNEIVRPVYNVIAQMRLATAPKGQLRPAAWVRRAGSTRSYVPCLRRRAARRPS
ncbi:hypothetical protein L917_03991 [Phytophthora nicotianae]|uniref:1,3-beta-glucan synthase component FKS1-like domain-containing protein n=1 Tax=Phytophthora nicotianae TaxID=4792 RepID=W2LP05_PHYNI|nr:hypothetical protein L917_03991 [Phytophthora nicotianae]